MWMRNYIMYMYRLFSVIWPLWSLDVTKVTFWIDTYEYVNEYYYGWWKFLAENLLVNDSICSIVDL